MKIRVVQLLKNLNFKYLFSFGFLGFAVFHFRVEGCFFLIKSLFRIDRKDHLYYSTYKMILSRFTN